MVVSALIPFIFLSKYGRQRIGIRGTRRADQLILALILGIAASLILYWVGLKLYGNSDQNWYKYIGRSYNLSAEMADQEKFIMFLIVAFTSMIFSPIGEELFFRGVIHGSFAASLGERRASMVDSSAFALTHIAHFGWVYIDGTWQFFLIPALLWVVSMFLVSVLFFSMKKKASSLLGAICCHAGFNLGMIYCIFYGLKF
jgi:membrane protease YdiL (CAAX protease family)